MEVFVEHLHDTFRLGYIAEDGSKVLVKTIPAAGVTPSRLAMMAEEMKKQMPTPKKPTKAQKDERAAELARRDLGDVLAGKQRLAEDIFNQNDYAVTHNGQTSLLRARSDKHAIVKFQKGKYPPGAKLHTTAPSGEPQKHIATATK